MPRCYHEDMALSFIPAPGSVVICDFRGNVEPEMVKKRRAVVVSPVRFFKYLPDATVIVVPLSELEPQPLRPWHHPIRGGRYTGIKACWAKGDLVTHVGLFRLDRVFYRGGWIMPVVDGLDLIGIRRALARATGMHLT
jgi:uncharacterized protein YifN (PemK superfamily)